ncbi:MAG: hypothetical protein WBP34_06105, partial [Thermoanaerobaculia bacterium]
MKVTQEFKTGHFYIQTGLQDVPAITEILEQFDDHLVEFFQEEPEEPIQVVVFDSQAEFEEELRSIDPSGAGQGFGGLYTSSTNTAYLWHEENEMRLRSKLLHEVVHAFRGNIGESGVFPADWYSEGIADYFALHCWAGAVLQTG